MVAQCEYEATLTKSVAILTHDLTRDQLSVLIDSLISETQSINNYGHGCQERIQTITTTLETVKTEVEQAVDEAPVVDLITGLIDRKSFDAAVRQMIYTTNSLKQDLCLLLIEVDRFAQMQKQYGSETGERILRGIAAQINKQVRGSDVTARYASATFAVLLSGTNLVGAKTVSENLRHYFSSTPLKNISVPQSYGQNHSIHWHRTIQDNGTDGTIHHQG